MESKATHHEERKPKVTLDNRRHPLALGKDDGVRKGAGASVVVVYLYPVAH